MHLGFCCVQCGGKAYKIFTPRAEVDTMYLRLNGSQVIKKCSRYIYIQISTIKRKTCEMSRVSVQNTPPDIRPA